jgi:hypothetical protein
MVSILSARYANWPAPGVGCPAAAWATLPSCAAAAGDTASGKPATPAPPVSVSTPTSDATATAALAAPSVAHRRR